MLHTKEHFSLLVSVGEMYLKLHRSWNKQGPTNSSSCSSKHFVVCAIFAEGTWCGFTQRLLHPASGNTINLKRISMKEVITIVLMWTCSSILNLLNPMPWQVWNLRILQGQDFFFLSFFFRRAHMSDPNFIFLYTRQKSFMLIFLLYQDGETSMQQ